MKHTLGQLALATLLTIGSLSVQAQDKKEAPIALRDEVRKPLIAAQEALKNNQPAQALELAATAKSVPNLTRDERVTILQLQALASNRAQAWDVAIPVLEELVAVADLPAQVRVPALEALMVASVQKKDNARLARVGKTYFEAGGSNAALRDFYVQGLYYTEQFAEAAKAGEEKMRLDREAGKTTAESVMRFVAASYRQTKNDEGYLNTLIAMAKGYPDNGHWMDVAVRLMNRPTFAARNEVDFYRFLDTTNSFAEAMDYARYAELSIVAGLPSEALRALEKGQAKGHFKEGSAERKVYDQLHKVAVKKDAEDNAQFDALVKSAKDGNALASLGDVYASKQQWAQANEAYAKALAMGKLRREGEVRLHHGVSLFKAGNKAGALEQLNAAKGEPTIEDAARLWLHWLN